jgi:hypothetical protein
VLGIIYLIAFWSLSGQIIGLVGEHGILPARLFLEEVKQRTAVERFWLLPTLFWINVSDPFLHGVAVAGLVLSVGLISGFLELPILCLLWLSYLSLVNVGGDFLSFQWDSLLLETGFLSIFLTPLSFKWFGHKTIAAPPKIILWLLRWLLFRLMFSSGVVKLASGDPAWRSLTALRYHYETQPLPTRAAWYFHQLPGTFQDLSVVVMFVIELAVPLLIFGSKPLRLISAVSLILFQVLIFITGNYCFFNLLAIGLCLLLVDDSCWPQHWLSAEQQIEGHPKSWPKWVQASLAVAILLISSLQLASLFDVRIPWPSAVIQFVRVTTPFHIVNSYGLFAVMTTRRPEIIIEGSRDGSTWLPYEFKYKPGDLRRPPMQVAPHQPRLDWQMWFAALGSYQDNPWFINFEIRLLQGSPEVLKLLKSNPFPGRPPRYIRAPLYDYHFTDWQTLKRDGTWWRRERLGPYAPTLSLQRAE